MSSAGSRPQKQRRCANIVSHGGSIDDYESFVMICHGLLDFFFKEFRMLKMLKLGVFCYDELESEKI